MHRGQRSTRQKWSWFGPFVWCQRVRISSNLPLVSRLPSIDPNSGLPKSLKTSRKQRLGRTSTLCTQSFRHTTRIEIQISPLQMMKSESFFCLCIFLHNPQWIILPLSRGKMEKLTRHFCFISGHLPTYFFAFSEKRGQKEKWGKKIIHCVLWIAISTSILHLTSNRIPIARRDKFAKKDFFGPSPFTVKVITKLCCIA